MTIQSQIYVFGNAWESDPGCARTRHGGKMSGKEEHQVPELEDLENRTIET